MLEIWERGIRNGALPYRDAPFEYPPVIGYLWSGFESIFASPVAFVLAWALVQAAAAGIVATVLTRQVGPSPTLLFWSLSPQLLLYGSLSFDTLAVAPLVIAVTLARLGRPVLASTALAVGTATKLFPAAALPVILLRSPDRRAVIAAGAAFVAIVGATFALSARARFPSLEGLFLWSVGFGTNFDSIWGVVRAFMRGTGNSDPVDAIVAISLAGMLVTYLVLVIPAARRRADASLVIGLALTTVLLWTRVYSPQYALWILPFFALCGLSGRTFALLCVADLGVFLTIFPLALVRRSPNDPTLTLLGSGLVAAVVLRHVALIITTRALWLRTRRGPAEIGPSQEAGRRRSA